MVRSPGAGDFALELLQPDAAPVGAGQFVGRRVFSVLLGLLAVACAELAVLRGYPAVARRTFTVKRPALPDLTSTPAKFLHSQRVSVRHPVAAVELDRSLISKVGIAVALPRELVAFRGRLVAVTRRLVA